MTGRRSFLLGTSATALALTLPEMRAEADPFTIAVLFGVAADLLVNLAKILSSIVTIKQALASPELSGHMTRAVNVIDAQSRFLGDMKQRGMLTDEPDREMLELVRHLKSHVKTIQTFVLTMEGSDKAEYAAREFLTLATEINELDGYNSSALFPVYSSATSIHTVLGKIALVGDTHRNRDAFQRTIIEYANRISGWADRSLPTNPLTLSDQLQPEINDLRRFTMEPRSIRVTETVVRTDSTVMIPNSSPPQTTVASRWHRNEGYIEYSGISGNGDINLEYIPRPRLTEFVGQPPFHYYWPSHSVGMFLNYTTPFDKQDFPCLELDNASDPGWDAVPNPAGTVAVPERIENVIKSKLACVHDVYKGKLDRLNFLTDQDAQYRKFASAMTDAAHSMRTIQV